jgi:hypothetical protein
VSLNCSDDLSPPLNLPISNHPQSSTLRSTQLTLNPKLFWIFSSKITKFTSYASFNHLRSLRHSLLCCEVWCSKGIALECSLPSVGFISYEIITKNRSTKGHKNTFVFIKRIKYTFQKLLTILWYVGVVSYVLQLLPSRAGSRTSQERWPWNCESPKESVQRPSQDTSNIM